MDIIYVLKFVENYSLVEDIPAKIIVTKELVNPVLI
jgi:hypothetical protein